MIDLVQWLANEIGFAYEIDLSFRRLKLLFLVLN